MVGVARRRPEAAGAVGRKRPAAGGSRGRPTGAGWGGGQKEPLKLLPRPQVSSAVRASAVSRLLTQWLFPRSCDPLWSLSRSLLQN